ncbi:hypothetical protein PHLCEN_2v4518 [Hermanssonia centrifuga]|uniref:Uncharacterized protein n=1 Tax=Hermanssonia centrifuga TaxID=98765 RepID=A0A2R6PND4_9APHY|nr:hypothetical protein PHLCEN_2v4518 [Hermanssonia centrifuga]
MASLASILLGYRYVLFGMYPAVSPLPRAHTFCTVLFVIFNAVIASVAAWDYGMAHETGHNQQIDAYLIFLGILGVIYIIPIAAVDILRKNAVPNRVWFECLWVGVFWVLELGASAVTANASNSACSLSGQL